MYVLIIAHSFCLAASFVPAEFHRVFKMLVPFVAPTIVTPTAGAAESKAAALRAAKSRPWILHNYCRLCDCEASDSHLLGNRHAKKTQAEKPWSPMCWKDEWFPVPLDYLPSQVPDSASVPAPSDAAPPPPPPADVPQSHVFHGTLADVDFRLQHVEQYLVALTSASSSTTTSVHISTATNVPAPPLDSRPSHLLRPKASSTAPPPSPHQHRQPGGMPIGAPIGFLAGGAQPARRRSRSHGRQSRRAP